jgi:hypothetical protein
MLPHKSMRRADVIASCVFMVLGVVVIYSATQMPWTSGRTGGSVQWYLSPGLFPAIVGALLILFSVRVLVQAIREGGHKEIVSRSVAWIRGLTVNTPVHRVILIALLLAMYVFGGVGRINFVAASALFLFVSIALFWWPGNGRSLLANIIVTAMVSVLTPLVIAHIFSTYLFVPMP